MAGQDEKLAAEVRKLLPETAGASVLAIDDGDVVLKVAYGVADVEEDTPATPATNYRMASVSKQFTATAILLLVDRGEVGLGDRLTKFFPGFPEWGAKITVRHLLTHTSGLPDYEEHIPGGTELQLDDMDVLHILMDAEEPLFQAGEKWRYSNSGYALLGLIVEVAAEKPFHEFVADEIFRPLKMNKSVLYQRGLNEVPHRAFGHDRRGEKWVRADQSLTSAIRGDGAIYTSLDDYEKWLRGLDERRLLSAESYREAFSPQSETDRNGAHYGYGWFIDEYRGERRIYHNGDTRGFRLTAHLFPDRRAAIVVQLNSDVSDDMTKVGQRIADRFIFDRNP